MAIKLRRGTHNQKLSGSFELGEPLYETDTKRLYIGLGTSSGRAAVLVGGNNTAVINEWLPNTRYNAKDTAYIIGIDNTNIYSAKVDHTSGSTFDASKWNQISGLGVPSFIKLSDTPDTYTGYGNKVAVVDSSSTGLVFDYVNATHLADNIDATSKGFNADLLDGHHSTEFSSTGHLHDDRYLQNTVTQDDIPDGDNYVQYSSDARLAGIEGQSTGQIEGGVITPTGGINFSVSYGHGFITDNSTFMKKVVWGTHNDLATVVDGRNFVYVDVDGNVFVSGVEDDYYRYIELGIVFSGGGNAQLIEVLNVNRSVKNFPQKVLVYQQKAVKAIISYGSDVVERELPNHLQLQINAGSIYTNFTEYPVGQTINFNKMHLTSNYGWVPDLSNLNLVSPYLWNDITKGYGTDLVGLTDHYWKKDLIFRVPSGNVYYIYSQAQYATKELALNSPFPYLPEQLTAIATFLAVIVCKKEDTSIASRIVDIRPEFARIFNSIITGTKLPAGGSTDQILVKIDNTDFNSEWRTDVAPGLDKQVSFNDGGAKAGDVGLTYDKSNTALGIGAPTTYANNPLAIGGNFDSYLQVNIKNNSIGTSASSDYIATTNDGSDDTNYVDIGINNQNYNDADFEVMKAHDSYLLANGGNLTIGTMSSTGKIVLHTEGTLNGNIRAEIDTTGISLPAGESYKVNGFDLMNIVTTAANSSEEAAAFAAGSKIVIRTDLL